MVCIQVLTDYGRDARRLLAFGTDLRIQPFHTVHIGRGSAQITQIAFEVRHLGDRLDFFQDGFFTSGGDELPLMGGDGTKGTTAKASAMDIDRKLDHLEGWDHFALVLRMGQAGIGQVEAGVNLGFRHGREGWIDDKGLLAT